MNGSSFKVEDENAKEVFKIVSFNEGIYLVLYLVFNSENPQIVVLEDHDLVKVIIEGFVVVTIPAKTVFDHLIKDIGLVKLKVKEENRAVKNVNRLVGINFVRFKGSEQVPVLFINGFKHGVEEPSVVVDFNEGACGNS